MPDRIPHIYYYVPPCPACGSRKTGRYVRRPIWKEDAWYVESRSLRCGELVRLTAFVPYDNAYCEECGGEWHKRIEPRLMNSAAIQEEKKARGTEEKYAAFLEQNPARKKSFAGRIFGLLP